MLLPSVSDTITNVYQKTFNFVNTDTPCRKKAEACEKISPNCYVDRFKKFLATSECSFIRKSSW